MNQALVGGSFLMLANQNMMCVLFTGRDCVTKIRSHWKHSVQASAEMLHMIEHTSSVSSARSENLYQKDRQFAPCIKKCRIYGHEQNRSS